MPRHLRAVLAALLAISMLSTAAGAWSVDLDDEAFADVEFLRQDTWFTSSLPVGNVATLSGDPITWTTDAPTGDQPSANVMNNYSTFTDILVDGTREWNTFTVEGTFTGQLDTIGVRLFTDSRNATAACGFDALAFEVTIDGVQFLVQDQASPSAGLGGYQEGDYIVTEFIFTRLYEKALDLGVEGDADTEHDIRINMANFYACNETVLWYDAAQTPSGMIFNLDPDSRDARFFTEIDVYNPPPPLES